MSRGRFCALAALALAGALLTAVVLSSYGQLIAREIAQIGSRLRFDTAVVNLLSAAEADKAAVPIVDTLRADARRLAVRARAGRISEGAVLATIKTSATLISADYGMFDRQHRLWEAAEILDHAADPTTVSQGTFSHNTCSVTTVEERAFTLAPDLASELIVEATLTGQWKSVTGMVVPLRPEQIVQNDDEANYPVSSVGRTLASEVFQVTLLTGVGLLADAHAVDLATMTLVRGSFRFAQLDQHLSKGDTGEFWIDSDGQKLVSVGLDAIGLQTAIHLVFGSTQGDTPFLIADKSVREGNATITRIASAADLSAVLGKLETGGQMPAILMVKSTPEDEDVDHVVNISSYDLEHDRAYVVNPWGQPFDRWMAVSELYKLSHS